MFESFKCPKCGQVCPREGQVDDTASGEHLDIFQCGNKECNVHLDLMGQKFEAAYTFAVGPDGQAFDPAESMDSIDDD